MNTMLRIGSGLALGALVLLLLAPTASAATRTFDFEGTQYGNSDDFCTNNPPPPMFNVPEYSFTKDFLWGDALPRGDTVGCSAEGGQYPHGIYDFGSSSYYTRELEYFGGSGSNRLIFSWDNQWNLVINPVNTDVPPTVTGMNWTEASRRLTKTNGFNTYNWFAGDTINITAGTGVTPGVYAVTSKVDNSTIELGADITAGTANITDNSIAGAISHNGYIGLSWTAATKRLTRTNAFSTLVPFEGDKIVINAGTGVTPGTYLIAQKVNNSTIELVDSIAAADVTDSSIGGTVSHSADAIWARVITDQFSYTTPVCRNPTIHLGVGSSVSMKFVVFAEDINGDENTAGKLELSLAIRETGRNLPLGEDGGTAGSLELVGVDTALRGPVPVGGVTVTHSSAYQPTTVKWTFVDRSDPPDGTVDGVDVTVTPPGGSPTTYQKNIAAFGGSGDGVLAATPYNRGAIDSLCIRRPLDDDTSVKLFVYVDDVVMDAPGIADPVKIKPPLPAGQTFATVQFINPTATALKLYKTVGGVLQEPPIATASAPPADFSSGSYKFTGLTGFVQNDLITAVQIVDGTPSEPCDPILVSAFGVIDDFSTGVAHYAAYDPDNPALPKYRTYYDVSPIAWAYAEARQFPGEPGNTSLAISDGGWTNGVYAIYDEVFPANDVYYAKARMRIQESNDYRSGVLQYQLGVQPGGQHRGMGALQPCTIFGSMQGLTTNNDSALAAQWVSTSDFSASSGQDLLVALCTDVTSGGWNGRSTNWGGWYVSQTSGGVTLFVDDLTVMQGAPPINNCSEVPIVQPAAPLVAGATSVTVANVSAAADYTYVYVNDVLAGTLDCRALGEGNKTVPISAALRIGDKVRATVSYPSAANPGTQIEGCAGSPVATVGTGRNRNGIRLTVGLRETRCTPTAPGQDGGYTGSIEWVGASSTFNGAPQGKLINPSADWQTVVFYPSITNPPSGDPIMSYESGNGLLDIYSTFYKQGAFEHLAVAPDPENPNSGPYVLYIDSIQTGAATIATFDGFDTGVTQVMFRNPNYLTSFAPYLLSDPCRTIIDDTVWYGATGKSLRVEFQFAEEQRWARLTTYSLYGTPSNDLPNPSVYFNQPLTLRILYPPPTVACPNVPTVNSITPSSGPRGTTLTGVVVTGTNFVAGSTQVKLQWTGYVSGQGYVVTDVLARNVNVTSSTSLTCDLPLPANMTEGAWDLFVGTCAYGKKANAFNACIPPTLATAAISPTYGEHGATVTLTVSGTFFVDGGTTVKLVKGAIEVPGTNVTVASNRNSLTADFVLPWDPTGVGFYDLVLATCGGTVTRTSAYEVRCTTPVINGPLKAGDTAVTVTGALAAPQAITIYADGSPIGSKTSGFVGGGTESVTLNAPLVAGQTITARQTVGGVESCDATVSSGVVGTGDNTGLMLTLGIRENPNLTGGIGDDGVNMTPSGGSDSTYITSWLVLKAPDGSGYFTAVDRVTAHATDWLASLGGEANIRPAVDEAGPGSTAWQVFTSSINQVVLQTTATVTGVYPMSPEPDKCAAYAVVYVNNRGPNASVRIKYGSDDGIKIWQNGTLRVNYDGDRSYTEDGSTSSAFTLLAGWNTFVVKCSENTGAWGFGFRLVQGGDSTSPVPNIEVSTTRPTVLVNSSSLEWLGASTTVSGAPQGKLITPDSGWQTVTFTPGVDPVISYSGGNGVLEGTYGVLDTIAVTSLGTNTGPYELYIDNVRNGGTTFETFESYTVPAEVMIRPPRTSGSTSAGLLPGVDVATLDDTMGDASAKSDRIQFQFKDLGTNRWARLITSGAANRPSPQVLLSQPITLRVLLKSACAPPSVSAIATTYRKFDGSYTNWGFSGETLTGVKITGGGFAAGATVKLKMAGQADITATNVTVNSATQITCDLNLAGAAVGLWDVVVRTCADATLPAAFEVSPACKAVPQNVHQDFPSDIDVDINDFTVFAACFNGPNRAPGESADIAKCRCLDVSRNGDIDLIDFSAFSKCFNGPNNPVSDACGT